LADLVEPGFQRGEVEMHTSTMATIHANGQLGFRDLQDQLADA